MADIASIGLKVESDQIKAANVELRAMAPAASAAERAAQKWGTTTNAAAKSSEEFSKRVQGTIRSLEFERMQLTRTAAEKERYAAVRRAGVTAASAEGKAILASVTALQAQRAATESAAKSTSMKAAAVGLLGKAFLPLVGALTAAAAATGIWRAGMEVGDLADQAQQIGVTTDELQAYRFSALNAGIETEALDKAFIKLQQSMATAGEGNDEMIARFEKLGVKLLDANGQMKTPIEILPQLAKGLLDVSSSTEQTALMMELMGKSGAKMKTVLEEWAKGNKSVVDSAKDIGAVASKEVIEAWDKLGDRVATLTKRWTVFVATVGADIAIPVLNALAFGLEQTFRLLNGIYGLLQRLNSMSGAAGGAVTVMDLRDKLAEVDAKIKSNRGAATAGVLQAQRNTIAEQLTAAETQQSMQAAAGRAAASGLQGFTPPTGVERNPIGDKASKIGGSKSDPYKSAIESAKDYIATKKAETAAVGQTAQAAALLKHQTELLNKATNDNKVLTAAQKVELAGLAAEMAKADAALAKAKFLDDANTKAEEFIATQQLEREALFLSAEAAAALRFEMEFMNEAKRLGIELSGPEIDQLREKAGLMAKEAEETRKLTEYLDLAKDVATGFFSDIKSGLLEGKTLWESFGIAGVNALNKIADKLLSMAMDAIIGDLLGGLLKSVVSGAAGGLGGGGNIPLSGPGSIYGLNAKGNAFSGGNVIPFARGGIVSAPTVFPMARGGIGLMGEAGPEGILPLRRGRGGRLGVEANGQGQRVQVDVYLNDDMLDARVTGTADARIARASGSIVSTAVNRSREEVVPTMGRYQDQTAGGDWRNGR